MRPFLHPGRALCRRRWRRGVDVDAGVALAQPPRQRQQHHADEQGEEADQPRDGERARHGATNRMTPKPTERAPLMISSHSLGISLRSCTATTMRKAPKMTAQAPMT